MFRLLALAAGLAALPTAALADDSIAPETVEAVKKATVFVRVEGDGWAASGSGFVVSADGSAVLVATNKHVAAPARPAGSPPSAKPATLTVVFDSGGRTERSYPAALAAADGEHDLAVLRVAGVKDAPRPIPYADPPKLTETMPVYTFGFPFGKALSTGQGFPAVTVGKATVSSLRTGPDGELAVVQIDGNLNPGNSGGPVVDAKGRLAGVAVATVRDGPGIGMAVPAAELAIVMRGRPGQLRVTPKKAADGSATVRVEADLIDPTGKLGAATAYYVVVPPKTARPAGDLEKHPGHRTLPLTVGRGVAAAEFSVPAATGEVFVQVLAGAPAVSTRPRAFSLTPPPSAAELAGPPPAGWKEYTPRDKTFVMWVPAAPARQSERERNSVVNGMRLRVNSLAGRTADGLAYQAESVLLPPSFARVPRAELYDLFRGAIAAEAKGRVTESKDAGFGTHAGTEFVVEAGAAVTRARVCAVGSRVYVVLVTGGADLVAGADAETILSAYRLPTAAAKDSGGEVAGPAQRPRPAAKEPPILGGAFDPVFKDAAPAGGLLVGFEIGLMSANNTDWIRAVRPIYRAGEAETFGTQYGTQLGRVTTVKAKPGYAVGAISAKHGLCFDGMSVTFMRVTGGALDPTDSYESEWIGTNEKKKPTKLGGSGAPVVGIVGKSNAKDMTGMGLLFKGQEAFEPNAKKK